MIQVRIQSRSHARLTFARWCLRGGLNRTSESLTVLTTLLPPTDLTRHHRHASCFPRLQLSPTKTLTGSSISQRFYGFCFEFFCVVFLLQFRAVDYAGYTSTRQTFLIWCVESQFPASSHSTREARPRTVTACRPPTPRRVYPAEI